MGRIRPAPKGLLFVAITVSDRDLVAPITDTLAGDYGPVLDRYPAFHFSTFTDYYEEEMGPDLWKTFVVFHNIIPAEHIARYKHETNRLEESYLEDGRRRANIDPGIVTLHNFCLLTTKGFSHRIYLEDGVWAEVTLQAVQRRFQPLDWTYADYKTEQALSFMESARQRLKEALQQDG